MGFSTLRPLHPFKRSRFSSTSTAYGNHFGMKSGNLSSTLEKLYVWERKLYKEVKGEEKLRILYEKKCRRLRYLDNHGAESHKIDSTRALIKRLQTKLSIAIKSVDVISSMMHTLRDKELQPQLNELISGLIRMWKSMLECHQKQFQAIIDCKSNNIMARTESVTKVIRELEVQLINWYSGFHDWINTQRSFIEALNGWLIKWLPVKLEETPDGIVPFSPSRIEAPVVFIISNDWDNAMARVSESKVIEAMHNFALSAHRLWKSRDKERRYKAKAESLSEEYNRRLSSLQTNGHTQVYHGDQKLELIKRRLDEERGKHDQIMKQIQDIASNSVSTGLHPIFEALWNFSLETVKAYEAIRILEGGGGS